MGDVNRNVNCFSGFEVCNSVSDAKYHIYRNCVKARKKIREKIFDVDR